MLFDAGSLHVLRALALVVVLVVSGCSPAPARQVAPLARPGSPQATAPAKAALQTGLQAGWGQVPVYFVENRGQFSSRIGFQARPRNGVAYFSNTGVTLGVVTVDRPERGREASSTDASQESLIQPGPRWLVGVDFLGADPAAQLIGLDRTEAVFSYFKGRPDRWVTGAPAYLGVSYQELWPGIDLFYVGEQDHLKYSFVVQPGADPGRIALGYRGAEDVRLAEDGGLDLVTSLGHIHEGAPVTYQEVDGQHVPVSSAFVLASDPVLGTHVVGFDVGAYDPTLPLVIDPPVIVYTGFIGGTNPNGFDQGAGVAADAAGAAYAVGATTSTQADFPDGDPNANDQFPVPGFDQSAAGSVDAFVAKVRPDGTGLVYATFIGGSKREDGHAIAVDGEGNAYVTGQVFSNETEGFPLTAGVFDASHNGISDVFVTKLNPAGTGLVYSTYVGGSQVDSARGIALEPACQRDCSTYLTGETASANLFPPGLPGPDQTFNGGDSTTGTPIDAFVFQLNGAGSALIWGTYTGGALNDVGRAIAVDGDQNTYVTGPTASNQATFPNGNGFGPGAGQVSAPGFDQSHNGADDAFVAKYSRGGSSFVYVTYLGGSAGDGGFRMGVAVDAARNAYVTGDTLSGGVAAVAFPTTVGPDTGHAGSSEVFIAKLNPAGTALVYSGFVGGTQGESPGGVVVDSIGQAYVAGRTNSSTAQGFPATGPDTTFAGNADVFVAKVRADGSGFGFVTYLGGNQLEEALGVALDPGGSIYLVGNAGGSGNAAAEIPTVVGPDLTHNGGGTDAFVAKYSVAADLSIGKSDAPDPVSAGQPLTYTLTVQNNGPDDALGIVVEDPLPVGLTFASAAPAQGSCTGTSVVTCRLGGLVNGASAAIQITVIPSDSGTPSNAATVSAATPDPNPNNNAVSTSTTINPAADLATTMTTAPNPVPVGGSLTYSVLVTNNGPSVATGVTATVTWPATVTFGSVAPSQGTCTPTPGQVACALGSLASGSTASIAVVVRPNTTNTVNATATVTGAVPDPNGANNSANVNTTVVVLSGSADLVLTVGDAPDPARLGEGLAYTASVRNAGPDAATGVQVNAAAPDDTTVGQVAPTQGTCTVSGSAVSCALGDLASGATASIAVNVTPTTIGTVALTANVTSGVPDPQLANNSAAQGTTVNAALPGQNDCSVRPAVQVAVVRDTGPAGPGLRVTVTAVTSPTLQANSLVELRFGNATNALIDIPGGASGLAGNVTIPLPPGGAQTTFFVRRQTPSGAATVPLTVVDACGDFQTFVGGGPQAFP